MKICNRLIVIAVCIAGFFACKKDRNDTGGKNPYQDTVAPLILISRGGVTPERGTVGTEVSITGKGFAKNKDRLSILFNGQKAEILAVTDSAVRVKVPKYASTGNINAQVGQQYFFGPFFRVMGPMEMDTVYPSSRGANRTIQDIIPVDGGKYLIVGDFDNFDNANIDGGVNRVARINADGTLDKSFKYGKNTGSATSVLRAAQLPDGKFLVAGSFGSYEGLPFVNAIARLYNNGGLETVKITRPSGTEESVSVLKGGISGTVTGLHVQADGKMIIVGSFRYYVRPNYDLVSATGADSLHLDSTMVNYIARLHADGTLDTTYNYDLVNHRGKESVNGGISKSILLPDGKLLITGAFDKYNGLPAKRIARLNADGSLDATFKSDAGANMPVYDIAPQPDGKYIISGIFTTYGGVQVPHLARISPDGEPDLSFQPGKGVDGMVNYVSVMPQGQIILTGFFSKFNNTVCNNYVVLNADGSLHETYNTTGGFNLGANDATGAVGRILQIPGEKAFLATGSFTRFDLRPVTGY
jgi:uncharacterized delta-60 repeat protein